MYVCVPCVFLMLVEVRRAYQIPWSYHVGAGTWNQVLCKKQQMFLTVESPLQLLPEIYKEYLGMVSHASNPRIAETEAVIPSVQDQHGICIKL